VGTIQTLGKPDVDKRFRAHAECAPRRVGRNHAGNTAAGRGRSRRDQHHRGGRPRHAFSLYSCIRKFQIGHTRDIRL